MTLVGGNDERNKYFHANGSFASDKLIIIRFEVNKQGNHSECYNSYWT